MRQNSEFHNEPSELLWKEMVFNLRTAHLGPRRWIGKNPVDRYSFGSLWITDNPNSIKSVRKRYRAAVVLCEMGHQWRAKQWRMRKYFRPKCRRKWAKRRGADVNWGRLNSTQNVRLRCWQQRHMKYELEFVTLKEKRLKRLNDMYHFPARLTKDLS